MHKLGLLVLLLVSVNIYGQQKKPKAPKCNSVRRAVVRDNSPTYYPELLARYLDSDNTLTLREKRLLYYGFVFQKEFINDRNKAYKDSLRIFFGLKDLTDLDAEKIILFSDSILTVNPFNLRALNYREYAFEHFKEKDRINNVIFRINTVLEAIFSSGHGLSTDYPFYVIRESDEYAVIDALGFYFGGKHERVDDKYDYLTLQKNNKGIEGFYFYVNTCKKK